MEKAPSIQTQANFRLGLFIAGLATHIVLARFAVGLLGPAIAKWINGFVQTGITIYVVHALMWLFHKNAQFVSGTERSRTILESICFCIIFWSAFGVHMWMLWHHYRALVMQTGWITFAASLLAIGFFYYRVRWYLLPEMRRRDQLKLISEHS